MARYWKTNNITTLLFFGFFLFPMCSHHVLIRFSLNPQKVPQVPKLFPQHVLNNTSVISPMVCPKFKPHVYKLKRWVIGSTFVSILWKRCFYWKSAQCSQKNWWWAKSRRLLQNKRHEHTYELINMNYTMSIWGNFVPLERLSFKFFIAI